jgi:hypothetical protein
VPNNAVADRESDSLGEAVYQERAMPATITIRDEAGSEVTFLRLVPLVGG